MPDDLELAVLLKKKVDDGSAEEALVTVDKADEPKPQGQFSL